MNLFRFISVPIQNVEIFVCPLKFYYFVNFLKAFVTLVNLAVNDFEDVFYLVFVFNVGDYVVRFIAYLIPASIVIQFFSFTFIFLNDNILNY